MVSNVGLARRVGIVTGGNGSLRIRGEHHRSLLMVILLASARWVIDENVKTSSCRSKIPLVLSRVDDSTTFGQEKLDHRNI